MRRCELSGRQSLCRGPSLSSCRHCWQTAEGAHNLRQHGLQTAAPQAVQWQGSDGRHGALAGCRQVAAVQANSRTPREDFVTS